MAPYVDRHGNVGGSKTIFRKLSDFFFGIIDLIALFFTAVSNPPQRIRESQSTVRFWTYYLVAHCAKGETKGTYHVILFFFSDIWTCLTIGMYACVLHADTWFVFLIIYCSLFHSFDAIFCSMGIVIKDNLILEIMDAVMAVM